VKHLLAGAAAALVLLVPDAVFAAGMPALSVNTAPGGGQTWTLSVQVLATMTALTLLPAALLMTTAFTRIVIVLGLLRHALGTGQTPSNQILVGLSLFLTFFVMQPVLDKAYATGVAPYVEGKMEFADAAKASAQPLREFMLAQTHETDLMFFGQLSGHPTFASEDDVPFTTLVAAFMTSELKTAFQIGFLIFIPFVVIDLVVSAVLMSMGMMMLSPMLISLPFKLMLFVLVDGWTLIMGTLAGSFIH
jgi:flagellar biosynthesis protein FliP